MSLRKQLGSQSELIEQDLDRNITLNGQYDFALALGLLYHLRNPLANHLPDGTSIGQASVAYLLRCRESNDDPTNYWTFSPVGLETALRRCGWIVKASQFDGSGAIQPGGQ